MIVIDEGLREKFHKEMKWEWQGDKNVHVHFFTKSIKRDRYNGTILFIDEVVPDIEDTDEGDNSSINMITITRQLTTGDIDRIYQAITEEYGEGIVSDEIMSKHLVLIQLGQSYIR